MEAELQENKLKKVTRDSNLIWYTLLSIMTATWFDPPVHLTWEKLRRCWVHCAVGGPLAIPLRHWFQQTWIYPPRRMPWWQIKVYVSVGMLKMFPVILAVTRNPHPGRFVKEHPNHTQCHVIRVWTLKNPKKVAGCYCVAPNPSGVQPWRILRLGWANGKRRWTTASRIHKKLNLPLPAPKLHQKNMSYFRIKFKFQMVFGQQHGSDFLSPQDNKHNRHGGCSYVRWAWLMGSCVVLLKIVTSCRFQWQRCWGMLRYDDADVSVIGCPHNWQIDKWISSQISREMILTRSLNEIRDSLHHLDLFWTF